MHNHGRAWRPVKGDTTHGRRGQATATSQQRQEESRRSSSHKTRICSFPLGPPKSHLFPRLLVHVRRAGVGVSQVRVDLIVHYVLREPHPRSGTSERPARKPSGHGPVSKGTSGAQRGPRGTVSKGTSGAQRGRASAGNARLAPKPRWFDASRVPPPRMYSESRLRRKATLVWRQDSCLSRHIPISLYINTTTE